MLEANNANKNVGSIGTTTQVLQFSYSVIEGEDKLMTFFIFLKLYRLWEMGKCYGVTEAKDLFIDFKPLISNR